MKKQWYTVTFSAKMTEEDVRAMTKYFYNAMEEAMQISPCEALVIEPEEDEDEDDANLLGYCECCGIKIYEGDVHCVINGTYYCDYCGGEDGLALSELDNELNPSICPYCGSENTDSLDFDWENNSGKHICRDCNQDYIAWYDDTTEECYEITDRHNKVIKSTEG